MRYRKFGSTPLEVSEIGFGCARLGGFFSGKGSKQEAVTLLRKALDSGITFFDTADMYSQGESESLLGQAFRQRRDQVVIATKGGYCLPTQRRLVAKIKPLVRPVARVLGIRRERLPATVTGALSQDFSPKYLTHALEQSLRRLRTDHVDLYQLHSPPVPVVEQAEFLDALERMKSQGKIRFYGVAADTAEDARAGLQCPGIASLQVPFGLLDQEALHSVFPQARERGIALISRGCFGGGLLKAGLTDEQLQELTPKWQRIAAFRHVAEKHNRSLLEMALQLSIAVEEISVTLLGMRTDTHLVDNLRHLQAPPLSDAEFREIT